MRILLTNDDGIEAEGLECLEKIARTLSDDVWVVAPQTEQSAKGRGISLTEPLRVTARTRYHQAEQQATVYPAENGFRLEFDQPQRAPTPGQAAVLYQGDVVLGGGTITRVEK